MINCTSLSDWYIHKSCNEQNYCKAISFTRVSVLKDFKSKAVKVLLCYWTQKRFYLGCRLTELTHRKEYALSEGITTVRWLAQDLHAVATLWDDKVQACPFTGNYRDGLHKPCIWHQMFGIESKLTAMMKPLFNISSITRLGLIHKALSDTRNI